MNRAAATLPYNLKIPIGYFVTSLAFLFVYRLVFLAVHADRIVDTPATDVLLAFAMGLRFDAAVSSILLAPFAVMATMQALNRFRLFRLLWIYGPVPVLIGMLMVLGSDIVFFENANKHIGYEAFSFLGGDLITIGRAALERNPMSILGGLLLLLTAPVLAHRLLRKFIQQKATQPWPVALAQSLIVIVLLVVGSRGGFQENPLRASNAIISENVFVNHLSLNGVFTVLMDLKITAVPRAQRMAPSEAALRVRRHIDYPGATFISDEFPLLRRQEQTRAGRPPNVVLILLENWTGKFVAPITSGMVDGKEVTPHFNRLVKQGLFFRRFFATGGRTTNGMLSVLTGIPDRPGLTVARTPQAMGNFSGFGNVLKQLDFQTLFVTGGDLSFDNKHTLMPHWGFERSLGKKHIDSVGRYRLGAWGYDDADVLDVLHRQILKMDPARPFLAVSLTLTTHYPYRTPHERFRIFKKETRDYEFLNVYHYADWAINDFLKKARRSKYFKNTVFIFVADHAHHRYLNYYEDRNIPFLIYAPFLVRPGVREDIASQLDVLPTVLGLVGKRVAFSSMGRDLLARQAGSAYFAYGNLFGWISDETFFVQTVESHGAGQAATMTAPFRAKGICPPNDSNCRESHQLTRAYLNLSYQLMSTNRVFPNPKQK